MEDKSNIFNSFIQKKLNKRIEDGNFRKLKRDLSSIDFCSNDYLGFARDPLHLDSIPISTGAASSRLIPGNHSTHFELEDFLKQYFKSESALFFNSGYDANLALFSALGEKEISIIHDQNIHASVIDGIRLGFAKREKFIHNDLNSLEDKLKKTQGLKIVAIESVYSMDGSCSDLIKIAELCKIYQSVLIVDEAHSSHVFNSINQDLEICKEVLGDQLIRLITFAKAFGLQGAAVLGSADLINLLINYARPFIYSTASIPLLANLIFKRFLDSKNWEIRKNQLINNIQFTDSIFDNFSYYFGKNNPSAIRVIKGLDIEILTKMEQEILNNNIEIKLIKSPTVSKGEERIRICLHSFNSEQEINLLFNSLKKWN